MSTEQNKAIVQLYREAHNTNQLDRLDEIVAANLIAHNQMPGLPPGLEGGKMAHMGGMASFPDMYVKTEDLIAEGDKVVERWTQTGTYSGAPFFGAPANGKKFSYQSANCGRIRRRSSQTRRRNDMPRVTRAAAHLSSEEVKQRLKTDPRPWCRQRWLIIYNALIEPRKAEEIARHCGVSKATVHEVISTYNRLGIAAVETAGKGGRRREYLTLEEEEQFLAPFFARAESGAIATVAQIQAAFEEQVGHEVDDSTIYRLLNRHGWRKLMPRPRHPQANLQAQEQFKKNLKRRLTRQSQRGQSKMSAPS